MAQCLCLRPPSALPQVISAESHRRKGGVAQSVCQRPPSVLLGVIPFEIQFNQGRRQDSRYGLRQADGSCPLQAEVLEAVTLHHAVTALSPCTVTLQGDTVTLHHAFKPFNLSTTCPQALGNSSPSSSLAYTTASALSTAVRNILDVQS